MTAEADWRSAYAGSRFLGNEQVLVLAPTLFLVVWDVSVPRFREKHYQHLGETFAKCEFWFYDRVVDKQTANARSRFMDIGWESGWR